jgi:hypothetical protein
MVCSTKLRDGTYENWVENLGENKSVRTILI